MTINPDFLTHLCKKIVHDIIVKFISSWIFQSNYLQTLQIYPVVKLDQTLRIPIIEYNLLNGQDGGRFVTNSLIETMIAKAETQLEDVEKVDGKELRKRLQNIILKLETLLEQTKGQKQTELLMFLCSIVAEFQLEVETDFQRFHMVSVEDRLNVLADTERGTLCRQVYLSSKERGMAWDLNTIMRGLLSPREISEMEETALERKTVNMQKAKEKARLLSSMMGKGVLLLSVSLIKYSWYKVMQENYNQKNPNKK